MWLQNTIYKCHPEKGSKSGTCHKTLTDQHSQGEHWGFKGTACWVTCDPGLDMDTISATTSTWIFFTWQFQSCHPKC